MDPIPVTLLTGFLGSGKTTLLAALLRRPELSRTAVIINEFGEIGLDHLLVETSDESMVEMDSGCLCCTIRGDLSRTMLDLFGRRKREEIMPFERLVIETTGLADPAPILHTLMTDPAMERRYRLDGVVTTVDAVNGEETIDRQPEALKQAAVADRIVITKTDLVGAGNADARTDALRDKLATLNPSAPRLEALQGEIDPEALFNAGLFDPTTKTADVTRWLRDEAFASAQSAHGHADPAHDHQGHGHDHHGHAPDHAHDVNRHGEQIRAFCITRDEPLRGDAFELFMDVLLSHRGTDLLRVKGILNIAETPDRPVVIHGVQHVFHPPVWLDAWPDDDHRSRIVFVTRDLPASELEGLLDAFTNNADRLTGPNGLRGM